MKKLKIGTRGSSLALWQAEFVKNSITHFLPGLQVELIKIKTRGDNITERSLSEIGGKGVFVKEIEDSLLVCEIDIAVHSLKDLPTKLPDGLEIGAFIKRHNPFDILVSENNIKISEHSASDKIGTGSLRRKAQLLHKYPDLKVEPIRGNVDTRINKVGKEGLTSVVLAGAGVERLGLGHLVSETFGTDVIVPAPGQGVIAIECRKDDEDTKKIIAAVNDHKTRLTSEIERSFLETLGGDCNVPAGCYAEVKGNYVKAEGVIIDTEGKYMVKDNIHGEICNTRDLGKTLGELLLSRGGEDILTALKNADNQ